MRILPSCGLVAFVLVCAASADPGGPDYNKRAAPISHAAITTLVGRWSNPLDHLDIDIATIDATTGKLAGTEDAPDSASDQHHDLLGWVNDAPEKPGWDHVVPVTFTTTLHEYGTLPVWAGFLRGRALVTMHYLVWPNTPYNWNHTTSGQETWTKLPAAGEWAAWPRDRKLDHMQAIVAADARALFAGYDAARFADVTCKSCHGSGAVDGSFKMPNPALTVLDLSPTGVQELNAKHAKAVAFMQRVTRRTATLLGVTASASLTDGSGFGCLGCHTRR
jgi:hypothetical protein